MVDQMKVKNEGQSLPRYRSMFWPALLIVVGGLWLLVNYGVLAWTSIAALLQLWPLILIVIGVELLVAPRNPRLAGLIGVAALAGAVLFAFVAPSLGFGRLNITSSSFTAEVAQAKSVSVTLAPGVARLQVSALQGSSDLMDAKLKHVGTVAYDIQGTDQRTISLKQNNDAAWNWMGISAGGDQLNWDVRLNPTIPVQLKVNTGVGDSVLDLSTFKLTGLNIDSGVGATTIVLPGSDQPYEVSINGGVGAINVEMKATANIKIKINGGVGSVTVTPPDGAAVRLTADKGTGQINVPNFLKPAAGNKNNDKGGVWETVGFNEASRKIEIDFDGGVGSFTLR